MDVLERVGKLDELLLGEEGYRRLIEELEERERSYVEMEARGRSREEGLLVERGVFCSSGGSMVGSAISKGGSSRNVVLDVGGGRSLLLPSTHPLSLKNRQNLDGSLEEEGSHRAEDVADKNVNEGGSRRRSLLTNYLDWQTEWWLRFLPLPAQLQTSDPTWNYSGHTLLDILSSNAKSTLPMANTQFIKTPKNTMAFLANKLSQQPLPSNFSNASIKHIYKKQKTN